MNRPEPYDPRWILLVENGQFSTISRFQEPRDEDVAAAETALTRADMGGWIAKMSGTTYAAVIPDLTMVRQIRRPKVSFEQAVEAFRKRLSPSPTPSIHPEP